MNINRNQQNNIITAAKYRRAVAVCQPVRQRVRAEIACGAIWYRAGGGYGEDANRSINNLSSRNSRAGTWPSWYANNGWRMARRDHDAISSER